MKFFLLFFCLILGQGQSQCVRLLSIIIYYLFIMNLLFIMNEFDQIKKQRKSIQYEMD